MNYWVPRTANLLTRWATIRFKKGFILATVYK
jgi:hypothetical protein